MIYTYYNLPCDPLTTIPSSANTATQLTSVLCPVSVDGGRVIYTYNNLPCDPLTTIPSSANTATQLTSVLCPVSVDLGVG